MPTYSYYCSECENQFDAFHSMMCSDPQLCPSCNRPGKRLLSASSVIFKGSGFYSTDYRDSGYLEAKKRDSDSPSTPPKDGSSGGSSDKKAPEKKSAEKSGSEPSTPVPSSTTAPAGKEVAQAA